MFSSNLQESNWLIKYLLHRFKTPFTCDKRYDELKDVNSLPENLDSLLYTVTKENGIIFGCPIITPYLKKLAKKLNFPQKNGGTVLLFLETLFSVAMVEKKILLGKCNNLASNNYENVFLQIIFLVIDYHLPGSFYRIPKDLEHQKLLKNNEPMKRALKKLEIVFLDSVTLKDYSSLGNKQNNFAFLKLYFFLLWAREKSKNNIYPPYSYHKLDYKLREEIIIMFAALVQSDNFVDDTEKHFIEKYIEQTGLKKDKKTELLQRIRKPVKIENIHCTYKSSIINSFIVEQLILLSLVDNQKTWQERMIIQKISNYLGISEKKLELLFCSVAEFFSKHYKRLEFVKNNKGIKQFQDYMNDLVVSSVKKNLNKIMNEIMETKELSELLIKSTSNKLTKKEKQKVQEQLLDIAKSIPALAIFALPGGGLIFPVIIKILPFNILPSSFQDDTDSSQILEK